MTNALAEALREAERFMSYFSDETDGCFVGSGTPATCLVKIRAALAAYDSKGAYPMTPAEVAALLEGTTHWPTPWLNSGGENAVVTDSYLRPVAYYVPAELRPAMTALPDLARDWLRIHDEAAALRAERDAFRRNASDTWAAMCSMRDSINEVVPMPSLESDLLQGPENSIFCATVAKTVVSHINQLQAALDMLASLPAPSFAGGWVMGRDLDKVANWIGRKVVINSEGIDGTHGDSGTVLAVDDTPYRPSAWVRVYEDERFPTYRSVDLCWLDDLETGESGPSWGTPTQPQDAAFALLPQEPTP